MRKFHRYISLFLCLVCLLSFALSPIRAHAVIDPAYSTAYAVIGGVAVEGFKEGAKMIASALGSVWNKVFTYDMLQTCVGMLELMNFAPHSNEYSAFAEGELSAGQVVLSKVFLQSVASAYKVKTGLTLSTPANDVTIHVPPESVWSEAELITSDRLNYRGFSDLTEVNDNILAGNQISWQLKKDLNGLELYLRTTFVELLSSEFDDLSTVITTKLSTMSNSLISKLGAIDSSIGDLETSIDVMTGSITDGLRDLKTLYSSFGNATLDKLDVLNTSIQNISLGDLSADFVNLRETIALYQSNILTSITDIPDQVSDSLSVYFNNLTDDLHDISNKLGAESSYLQDLLGESQVIRDLISNGFADVLVALDSLEIDATLDLQPVLDQLTTSQETYVSWFDSLYMLIDSGFISVTDMLESHFNSFNDLLLNEYLEIFAAGVDSIVSDFQDLLSDTSNLVEVKVSLDELVGSNLLSTDVFKDVFLGADLLSGTLFDNVIGDLSNTVWNRIQDLLDHLTTAHSNLSSRIGSINSNLSGKITDFKDALIGDLVDLKSSFGIILESILTGVQSIAGKDVTHDDSLLGSLSEAEIPLYQAITSGFSEGGNFFGLTTNFLVGELDGFLVAAKIMNEFSGISFFEKLIVASVSIGLVGALLGMALNAASYSMNQRRREEAAQAKAYNRIERSYAA